MHDLTDDLLPFGIILFIVAGFSVNLALSIVFMGIIFFIFAFIVSPFEDTKFGVFFDEINGHIILMLLAYVISCILCFYCFEYHYNLWGLNVGNSRCNTIFKS